MRITKTGNRWLKRAAREPDAVFEWRDLQDHPIKPQQAKALAYELSER